MIRKITIGMLGFMLSMNLMLKASEGMWIPALLKSLNESEMKSMGMRLSAEDIYSINKSSLKDAIVHFGGGCTAEVVSTNGLILTNHHCGFSQIQSHSSVENDYLKYGFWAKDHASELMNEGLTATFIVRVEDVTKQVLQGTAGKEDVERAAVVATNIRELESRTEMAEKGHEAKIKPFFYGNEYYMIVTKTYRDVRLVGAPPSSVGKYGGDTDNWMWPRHTGDFSVFRIYADGNNEPAAPSVDNVPFKPAKHFPVSLKGTKPGDFTLVYGFPGRTQQYLHSRAVKFITEKQNPATIEMRRKSLEVIDAKMLENARWRIAYAGTQARISNYYKKWIGENRGLEKLDAVGVKEALERDFAAKVNANADLKAKYGDVQKQLVAHYDKGDKYLMARSMLIEFYYVGPAILRFTRNFETLVDFNDKLSEADAKEEVERLKKLVKSAYKNYDPHTDMLIFAALYGDYIKHLSPDLRPDLHKEVAAKYGKNYKKYAEDLFAKSYFTDEAKILKWLDNYSPKKTKKLKKDPAYRMMKSVLAAWREKASEKYGAFDARLSALMQDYVKGMMTVFPNKRYWPDANSTLRVTYGKVEGSEPRDGVEFTPYTTMDGVLAKYVPGDRDFDLPDRLIDLAKKKDFGQYGNEDGDLVICFTASNHTTGGNSGSPVIDGDGNLIGINFDRSWESTMSDIMFDPERCRNIVVDIRYVLFIMDKYAGAGHLVNEMTLVK